MTDGFTITNGTVEFEHKNPYTEYGFKAPKVSLSFTIAEGSDAATVTARVMGIAVEMVERANHTTIQFGPQVPGTIADAVQAERTEPASVPTSAPAATRTRRTKAQIEADQKAAAAGEAASSGQVSAEDLGIASSDPLKSNEPAPTQEVTAADLGIPAPEPEVVEISDTVLGAFANRLSGPVQKEHGNLNKLRDLINKYTVEDTPGYGHLMQIPADKRADFMAEAKKLVKADV